MSEARGPVRCDAGHLAVVADASLDEVTAPDVLIVLVVLGAPQDRLLKQVAPGSGCSGSIGTPPGPHRSAPVLSVLAAAGLLTDRRAATHWLAADWLAEHGGPSPSRPRSTAST